MSGETQPSREQLRDVQIWLNYLDARCEAEPRRVLGETADALPLLASWTSADAYAWLMALRAKAFRLVDDLEGVCETADAVLPTLDDDQVVVAHLNLEKGMSLTQFDRPHEAAVSLKHAAEVFGRHGDESGQAWALVALADAYCGSGYPEDPYPLLRQALDLSDRSGEERIARRAWKQLAVVHRHRGDLGQALAAIENALEGTMTPHARANYLLERGHLLAWSGRFADSDADYEEAGITYLEYGDSLGQGNVERALAQNALMLGRFTEGLRRLRTAAEHYRKARNTTALGYVLREQSSTRFALGDLRGAAQDAEEGLAIFRRSADILGSAGMLNTTARMRHRLGEHDRAQQLLDESLALTAASPNPLARANALALQAEIDVEMGRRVTAAEESARMFAGMGVWVGEAMAHAARAKALVESECDRDGDPMKAFASAVLALRRARVEVVDPGRRADYDFALRDVTTMLTNVAVKVGGAAADLACADLILDSAPLGLRAALTTGGPNVGVKRFIRQAVSLPVRSAADSTSQRHLLQQLSAILASIDTTEGAPWFGFTDMQATHPDQAMLVLGLPQHDGTLPIAWSTVTSKCPKFALVPLSSAAVDSIDSLGHAIGTERSAPLWEESGRGWQTELSELVLPPDLRRSVMQPGGRLAVLLPPLLAHLPIEALLVDGEPLGVHVAVSRIPAPSGSLPRPPQGFARIGAYLDPALSWEPERAVVRANHGRCISVAARAPGLLGTRALAVIGCHGAAETRLDSALLSTAGERVLDAIDLLRQPLTDSVVIFESCYSGRYLGERTGEQLTLATTALVAGASAAVAGLFGLPADEETTGIIVAALLDGTARGIDTAEALRRARQIYWESRPQRVRRPGTATGSMPADAPWAWAGLVAFAP